jgi:transposase
MAYNFLRGDHDQPFLLPQDLRDWLPEGHLAWFVLDVVDQLDLTAFYRVHRETGTAIPPTTPSCCSACCTPTPSGVRSSRQIERRLTEDVAFRVLAPTRRPTT